MEKYTLLPDGTLVKQTIKQPLDKDPEKPQAKKKPSMKKNHRVSRERPPGVRTMWEKFTG